MTQVARSAAALADRLATRYTNQFELSHTATSHPGGNFLQGIADVYSVTVHETDGAIARSRTKTWYDAYRRAAGDGGGPQLAVWADGTVVSLVELPYITSHATFLNGKSIGVESGHGNDGRFGDVDVAPDLRAGRPPRQGWREITGDAEDIAGSTSAKYYCLHVPISDPNFENDVLVAPWTTASYTTPAREQPGLAIPGEYDRLIAKHKPVPPQPTLMIWPEEQYRAWALLARYLAEAFLVPRNFPLLPHARRDHMTVDIFKRVVLADQRCDSIVNGIKTPTSYKSRTFQFVAADFTDPAQGDALRRHWTAANVPEDSPLVSAALGYANVALNLAWLRLFDFYRGFHGHGFSGNIKHAAGYDDHDCPGPLFDWHRFARETWDWWWYPFDFDDARTTTALALRGYRRADGATPLLEYYFDDRPAAGAIDPRVARASTPGGIHGASSSPNTFRLEEGSSVYALANGELVAARFPATGSNASMAFVLTRHEVFHAPDPGGLARAEGAAGPDATQGGLADPGRIDYDVEPSAVYSLVMHLERPNGMSFDHVSDANPDWLNRVLIRKKECDIALPAGNGLNLAPALAALPVASFTAPPGAPGRPTPIGRWRMDKTSYTTFMTALAAGNLAIAPSQTVNDVHGPTPVRIILGDFLGLAGVIRRQGGVSTNGVRVEIFSRTNIQPRHFTSVTGQTGWSVPAGVAHPAVQYVSEWVRTLSDTDKAALTAVGVDPQLATWWSDVQSSQTFDVRSPEAAKLPRDGNVFHYAPLDFMEWINDVTWTSEWPKYRIAGPRPAPRSRRV